MEVIKQPAPPQGREELCNCSLKSKFLIEKEDCSLDYQGDEEVDSRFSH
jgi:hypothetical protein